MKPSFAIVGCGRIAKRHAEQIMNHGVLKAVCDIIPQKANELAALYSCKPYYSIEELLDNEKEIDVVSICTPNGLHAHHAIKAMEAGINVLCEKPLCIHSKDGEKMITVSKQTCTQLFVVKQNRYNPPVVAVKKLLKESKLGTIYSFQINCFWNRPQEYYSGTWKGTKKLDGGVLFTQFSHFIDLLLWFLGDVKTVKAIAKNFRNLTEEIEDSGVALIEMDNGAIGTLNYTVNSFQKNMEGSFTIFGEKGTVKIGGQYLNKLEYQQMEGITIEDLTQGKPANNYGFYEGSMSNHDKVYENLVKALQEPGHELASASEGLKTIEVIEKIYASLL